MLFSGVPMKGVTIVLGLLLITGLRAQEPNSKKIDRTNLTVILLGTAGGPTMFAQRLGISTLGSSRP